MKRYSITIFRSGAPLWICLSAYISVGTSFTLFFKPRIFYNFYVLKIYLKNIKSLKSKNKNFCFKSFFFKIRLCSYINLVFLQFHFMSAKIYILQIYLEIIKSFSSKNTNFCFQIYFYINLYNFIKYLSYTFYSLTYEIWNLLI